MAVENFRRTSGSRWSRWVARPRISLFYALFMVALFLSLVCVPHFGSSFPCVVCVLRVRDVAILPVRSPPCHDLSYHPRMQVVNQHDNDIADHAGSETIDSIRVKNTQLTVCSLSRPTHPMAAQSW